MLDKLDPDAQDSSQGSQPKTRRRTLRSALLSITVAAVSMSLDNVLAVAAIADGNLCNVNRWAPHKVPNNLLAWTACAHLRGL